MRIAFYSNMEGSPWGASEDLWSGAALRLREEGHRVFANCKRWRQEPPVITTLRRSGVGVHLRSRSEKVLRNLKRSLGVGRLFGGWLRRTRPDLVVVNAGAHVSDVGVARECEASGVPYATLLHSLPPYLWYRGRHLAGYQRAYTRAERCFFVSSELRELLEDRLARRLPNSSVVANPVRATRGAPLAWPDTNGGVRLACVARGVANVKGQDLILRVLAGERWRDRPLRVSFWCEIDDDARHLMRLAEMHGVRDRVDFPGFASDIRSIWEDHHALILPSRFDAVPMTTIEAQLYGRVAIATDVGRNREFIEDDQTGFLIPAATATLLDQTLERAWQARGRWADMGRLAAERTDERFPRDPLGDFCGQLKECAERPSARGAESARPATGGSRRLSAA